VSAPGFADLSEITHAYAIVKSKTGEGRYYAVHLEGVTASGISILEPSGRPEPAAHGVSRILHALDLRHFKRAW
jgi:hypothetical protein